MMIKNLLFDLGGVIMDIERKNAVAALIKAGMENADEFLGVYAQKGPFLQLEDGSISAEEFRNEIRKYISRPITDNEIDSAFNEFLIGIPDRRLDALRDLREKGYGIYMISNTNPIMWNSRIAEEFSKQGHDMDYYFDGEVTSFEAKSCKPDNRIFETAIKKFNLNPDETLFFDDSRANTDAAARLGFHTALVEPGTEFTELLADKITK